MKPLQRLSGFALPLVMAVTLTSGTATFVSGDRFSGEFKHEPNLAAQDRVTDDRASRSSSGERTETSATTSPIPAAISSTTTTTVALTTTIPAPEPAKPASAAATAPQPKKPKDETPVAAPNVVDGNGDAEEFLLNALNAERSARGLPEVQLDPTLDAMAEDWSKKMAERGKLGHSGSGIPSGFNAFGENVLRASSGASASKMHNLWLQSSGHRKQMLQPGYDRVGIAAVCAHGSVYATQTFGQSNGLHAELSDNTTDPTPKAPITGGSAAC